MEKKVAGHLIELSNGSTVWMSDKVYKDPRGIECKFIKFTNPKKDTIEIRLSHEAMDALVTLRKQTWFYKFTYKFNETMGEWFSVKREDDV